jgi:hypothetical protein
VQFAYLYHPATATKTVRITRVILALYTASAASWPSIELRYITSAPTGATPAITPVCTDGSSGFTTECLAGALPTGAATEANVIAYRIFDIGNTTTTGPVTVPPPPDRSVAIYEYLQDHEKRPIILRPGVLEGVVLTAESDVANFYSITPLIVYTEE